MARTSTLPDVGIELRESYVELHHDEAERVDELLVDFFARTSS
jgi:hypothetical protein